MASMSTSRRATCKSTMAIAASGFSRVNPKNLKNLCTVPAASDERKCRPNTTLVVGKNEELSLFQYSVYRSSSFSASARLQ